MPMPNATVATTMSHFSIDERLLRVAPLVRRQAGVIRDGVVSALAQRRRQLVDVLAGGCSR